MWNKATRMTPDELVVANTPTGREGLFALGKMGCAGLGFYPNTFERIA